MDHMDAKGWMEMLLRFAEAWGSYARGLARCVPYDAGRVEGRAYIARQHEAAALANAIGWASRD